MWVNKKVLCLFGMMLLYVAVYAAPADDLNQKLQNFQTLSANFTQQVKSDDGTVLQTSQGDIEIKRPGLFRWNVIKPMQQLIVTDGKIAWISEPDLQQVTKQKLNNNIGQTPLLLLTGNNEVLKQGYDIQLLSANNQQQVYRLMSKNSDDNFHYIDITFKQNVPAQLKLYNNLGQVTTITFQNVKLNPSLSSQQFQFKVPSGVDVIDMTKQGQ